MADDRANTREGLVTARHGPASDLPRAFIDELAERTSLPDLVGRRVRLALARNGRVWKAACPFHEDVGTSFYVHADGYHCFGCGAHGDAVTFVMRMESITVDQAVARLAEAAGIQVPGPAART